MKVAVEVERPAAKRAAVARRPGPLLSAWLAIGVAVAGWPGGAAAGPASVAAPAAAAVTPAPAPGVINSGQWLHAVAAYDTPRYPADYKHFDYVDPDAPKGGTLTLPNPDRRTSFDRLNPFLVRGQAPAGVLIFMMERLMYVGADEPLAMYGMLAEAIRVAPDFSSVWFRLNPKARFSNGDPVLAKDVVHSFRMLTSPGASPTYQTAFAVAADAVAEDERTVRFDLKDRQRASVFTVGGLYVFSHTYGLGPDGTLRKFDDVVNEAPLTSGPYVIDRMDSGRRIEFRRNPEYWARDLPVRKGWFNFDRVVYKYYQDQDVLVEAFKAGEFDLVRMYGWRSYQRKLAGPKWEDGRIVKEVMDKGTGKMIQGYNLNLRRPIFQDIRVRHALNLSFDFDRLINQAGNFQPAHSLFSNSRFAAEGLPSPGELALLEPFRAELPPEVFGPPYRQPNVNVDADGLRRNLLKARSLLEQAGWTLAPDGLLRNAKGEPFVFEYMNTGQGTEREVAWQQVLRKLGITLNIRTVDYAVFRARTQTYDFDTIIINEPEFTVPPVSDIETLYGSKAAGEEGNNAFRGIRSRAVDRMIEAMGAATTLQQMQDAARAMDRVVMWNYYQVPQLWNVSEWASWWNRFGMPRTRPLHFTMDLGPDLSEYPAWPISTWWVKDLDRRAGAANAANAATPRRPGG